MCERGGVRREGTSLGGYLLEHIHLYLYFLAHSLEKARNEGCGGQGASVVDHRWWQGQKESVREDSDERG
jgi:hypothetical protein